MDFRSLQHIPSSQVHVTRACRPAPFRLQGFVYPLGGFLPACPGRLCFTSAALMGFHPSKLSPTAGSSTRLRIDSHPHTVLSCRCSRHKAEPARQAAVSGLCPRRKFLAATRELHTAAAGCSPGLFPFQGASSERLGTAFLPASSHALGPRTQGLGACATESLSDRRASSSHRAETQPSGKGNPLRVSAPVRPTTFERRTVGAMGSPFAAPCIAAGCSAIFRPCFAPCRSRLGSAFGAGHCDLHIADENIAQAKFKRNQKER